MDLEERQRNRCHWMCWWFSTRYSWIEYQSRVRQHRGIQVLSNKWVECRNCQILSVIKGHYNSWKTKMLWCRCQGRIVLLTFQPRLYCMNCPASPWRSTETYLYSSGSTRGDSDEYIMRRCIRVRWYLAGARDKWNDIHNKTLPALEYAERRL
jgi:hypothetical protein